MASGLSCARDRPLLTFTSIFFFRFADLECMSIHNLPAGSSFDYWLAWSVAIVFQIAVGLLLVNMLIAKMAKTFDSIWENQGVNFMYLRARTCMSWDEAPLVCPPLIILSWPTLLVNKVISTVLEMADMVTSGEKETVADGEALAASDDQKIKPTSGHAPPEMMLHSDSRSPRSPKIKPTPGHAPPDVVPHSGSPRRGVQRSAGGKNDGKRVARQATSRSMLTSVGARPSQEESGVGSGAEQQWSRQQEQEICSMLLNWIVDHEDEVNQSERWRTQMQKKNAKRFDRVDRAVSSVAASIKEIKKNQLQSSQINDKITELKTLVENLADATRVRRGSTAHAA